jgi:hypothetical protein
MKKILLILFTFFSFSVIAKDTTTSTVSFTQQLDHQIKYDSELENAMNSMRLFFEQQDSTFILENTTNKQQKLVLKELFPSYLSKKNLDYKFIISEKIENGYLLSLMLRFNYKERKGQESDLFIFYTYEGMIIKSSRKYYIDLSERKFTHLTKGNITYKYLNTSPDSRKINEGQVFLKTLTEQYQIKQESLLDYYVVNRKNCYAHMGFTYTLNATGRFNKKQQTLINVRNEENDIHELTHYFFQDYKFSKFISEGMAVYYGGTNGLTLSSSLAKEIVTFSSQKDSIQGVWIGEFLNGLLFSKTGIGEYIPFFYAFSGKIIADYLANHSVLELKKIIFSENVKEITPQIFIEKYLGIKNTEEYLLNILKE